MKVYEACERVQQIADLQRTLLIKGQGEKETFYKECYEKCGILLEEYRELLLQKLGEIAKDANYLKCF